MLIGTDILEYRLEEIVGEGGMGIVYRGIHPDLGHAVAIKVLDPLLARNSEIRERFIQEARIQIGLRHRGIVQVHTAETRGEHLALIMEYIDGRSLEDVIHHRSRIPLEEALPLFLQILEAVDYAHDNGIVHRDLKPSNIMVKADGTTKVMDFGIARIVGSSRLTRTGTVMGSAPYMSPEQIQGEKQIDKRTDIYSLGITLYEMITGRTPFEGKKDSESDFKIKLAHVQEAPPDPRSFNKEIPVHILQLLMKSLAKNPAKRFQTVREMIDTLKAPHSLPSNTNKSHIPSSPRNNTEPSADILTQPDSAAMPDNSGEPTTDISVNRRYDQETDEYDIAAIKTSRKKKIIITAIIVVALLLGTFGLLSKYTDIFKGNWSAKKMAKAQDIYKRKLAEQEKKKPIYGRAEFFIEPVPVNIYFNGKLDPQSPTKHTIVLNWKIKKPLTVKFKPVRKPTDKVPMWHEKTLTFYERDWKAIEGIRIIRKMVDMIPTLDNKDYVDPKKAARLKKKLAREKRRRSARQRRAKKRAVRKRAAKAILARRTTESRRAVVADKIFKIKPKSIVAPATIDGKLSRNSFLRTIHNHRHEIKYCYERELIRFPKLSGRIAVTLHIAPSGMVINPVIKSSTVKNKNLERCLLGKISNWTFPRPEGGKMVATTYPFIFRTKKKP